MLTRGRREEAWTIIARLHDQGTPQSEEFARAEFNQMEKQVAADAILWKDEGNKALFTKPSYRKRMWMGFFIQYAAQSTGAQVIYGEWFSYLFYNVSRLSRLPLFPVYIVSLYQNLGLTGGVPLIIGAVYVTVATLGNFVGALILDKVGRKKLLITGLTGCMLSVCLESAMIAQFAGTTNKAGLSMGVFFSFCFISFYGSCIDVVGYVYCCKWNDEVQAGMILTMVSAEIFPTHIRPQGVAWSLVGTFLSTLIYVEAAPTALANIQWRYYMVFVALTAINIVIVYFWCPEVSAPASRQSCPATPRLSHRFMIPVSRHHSSISLPATRADATADQRTLTRRDRRAIWR